MKTAKIITPRRISKRRTSVEIAYRDWLGNEFNAEHFVTLTASKDQAKSLLPFTKYVNIFVQRLNSYLYKRQYKSGKRSLGIYLVYESHKNGGFHAHLAVQKLRGDEKTEGKTFEQIVTKIWNECIAHLNGYANSDTRTSFDGTGLFDYMNKWNWKFDPDYIHFPK